MSYAVYKLFKIQFVSQFSEEILTTTAMAKIGLLTGTPCDLNLILLVVSCR
jgi:hypothetical protein